MKERKNNKRRTGTEDLTKSIIEIIFIDFKQAYKSISRYKLPVKITLTHPEYKVTIYGRTLHKFDVNIIGYRVKRHWVTNYGYNI